MKPTKEKFKEYLNYIIRKNEAETKIDSIISTYNDVYQDGIWPIDTGTGMMVEMLETMLDLPIDDSLRSTLSWWLYDMDFGEKFETGKLEIVSLPLNHEYRKPDLSTVDKLYDFLVWEGCNSDNTTEKVYFL